MMNVDDPPRIGVHKFLGKDLHVTCEYDEVNAMPLQQCHDLSLGCPLIFFLGRHQEERDAIKIRKKDKRAAERSEENTSEIQSLRHLVCRLLLEIKKND